MVKIGLCAILEHFRWGCWASKEAGGRRVLTGIVAGALLLATPVPLRAQDQTLADVRQELEFVFGEILRLRRELSTTGNAGLPVASEVPALQRIDALEQEVRRLTGDVERQQFQIDQIVKDGTNRIGDLEFRLCELESGCDIAALDRTAPLGGMVVPKSGQPGRQTRTAPVDSADATMSEQSSFNQAFSAFEAGDYANAAEMFESFASAFAGGPLSGEAYFWRGEALAAANNWSDAALSFLESFSGSPAGVKAPDALFRLGVSLAQLGQVEEACLMLSEVSVRYPASSAVTKANVEFAGLGCT